MGALIQVLSADGRGVAEHGWLSSRHTFSFGGYYDAERMGISDLRVINDDRVMPGRGFGRHPHSDMEIFSYVLDGALEHRDSMGTGSVIRPGDVQLMSAGTGVTHSEFNPSEDEAVHFLQIWIVPDQRGAEPRYQQQHFAAEEKRGRLLRIIGPDASDAPLKVRQDVQIYAGLFDAEESARLAVAAGRIAYVHVARGRIEVNGQALSAGDGLALADVGMLELARGEGAEILVFDLRDPRV